MDLLLANHPMIRSAGELTTGFEKGYTCSCLAEVDQCPFWGPIRRELQTLHPDTELDAYAKMSDYMDRLLRIPQLMTEWRLPAWVDGEYTPMTSSLFSLIGEKSGCRYVVDSSKDLGRAYYLLTRFPKRTKVIHLIRDGRGVMWSILRVLRRSGAKHTEAGRIHDFAINVLGLEGEGAIELLTLLSWTIGTAIASLFHLWRDRVLLVRYEDVCQRPEREFERIGRFLDLDMKDLSRKVADGAPLEISHNIGGNHMRHSETGTFALKTDTAWREQLPFRYKAMFAALALPIAMWYGYIR